MPAIDEGVGHITYRIVYFGPAGSGKRTNLTRIFAYAYPGEELRLETIPFPDGSHIIGFSFSTGQLRRQGAADYMIRLELRTIYGDEPEERSRALLLDEADGIVFVADSHKARMSENIQSLRECLLSMTRQGRLSHSPSGQIPFPFVVQCNKRDLSDALTMQMMTHYLKIRAPYHEAIAMRGVGVEDTINAIVGQIQSQP